MNYGYFERVAPPSHIIFAFGSYVPSRTITMNDLEWTDDHVGFVDLAHTVIFFISCSTWGACHLMTDTVYSRDGQGQKQSVWHPKKGYQHTLACAVKTCCHMRCMCWTKVPGIMVSSYHTRIFHPFDISIPVYDGFRKIVRSTYVKPQQADLLQTLSLIACLPCRVSHLPKNMYATYTSDQKKACISGGKISNRKAVSLWRVYDL
mmetsp:Transcript_19007/g.43288  ORF Transcript_19007/g.43288 Transcript_19007/m.43288 type:complete len:205 (-) Transcript_19007:375-989(-)